MAKRTDEKPFRPLETALVSAVMTGNAAAAIEEPPPAVAKPAAEPPRNIDRPQAAEEGTPAVVRTVPRYEPPMPRRSIQRERPTAAVSPLGERMEREKRVLVTPSEERILDRVVANIGAELGTSLKLSHVLRSCIRLMIHSENELIERARATGRTIRPPNGDLAAIEAFEKVVTNVLQTGIRNARPLR